MFSPLKSTFSPRSVSKPLVAFLTAFILAFCALAHAEEATVEDLRKQVEALQAQVESLKSQMGASATLEELERKIEALTRELERMRLGDAATVEAPDGGVNIPLGLSSAAAKVYSKGRGVSIGGYGEAVYQNFASDDESDNPSGKVDEFDFVRAIVYFGYKFNDRWLFNSEIEFEHGSTSRNGSVSVEFAYIDYTWRPELNFRFGMVLPPMGFLNEFHEAPTFLTNNRPQTEQRIIPSTWRENGLGFHGEAGGFAYRGYLVNGLDGSKFDDSGLRGGRQKGGDALAEDFGFVGRFDFIGVPGLLTGASVYWGNSGQAGPEELETIIAEGHLEWKFRGIHFRALGCIATVSDTEAFNTRTGENLAEEMLGGYVELGFDIFSLTEIDQTLTPFVRYEGLNTQESLVEGFTANLARERAIITTGVAYQPIPQLIFKADYEIQENEAESGVNQFNLGLGYIF